MEENFHVRVSILNPGMDVTPLKFRSWLRAEAAGIDQETRDSGKEHLLTIIRLFLPERLRVAIGVAKLDKILQGVVDKFETIHRVELRVVDKPLSMDEMMSAQAEVKGEMDSFREQIATGDNSNEPPTFH